MKELALSILFLFIFTFSCFANESIKQKFNSKNDIDKVSFFRNISNEDKEENVIFFYTKFNALLKNHSKNVLLQKQFLFAIGLINQIQNQHLEAISKFNNLIENKSFNLDIRESMDIYVAMQESYLKLNLYSKVFDVNNKINTLIANGADYPLWSYNIQSRLYLQLEQYDKAIYQLKKEISLLYKNPKRDSLIIPSAYNDLGYYNYLKKDNFNALKHYETSLIIVEKSLKTINSESYNSHFINVQSNIANVKLNQGKFDEAISIIEKITTDKNSTELQLILAEAYLGKNDFSNADKALSYIGNQIHKNPINLKIQYLELLTVFYELKGDFKNSYLFINQIKKINDSLASLDKRRLLQSNELNYFIEEKEKEVLNKNQIIKQNEKIILIIVIVSLLLILAIGIYFFQNNRKKRFEIEKMNLSITNKNKTIEVSLHEKEMLLKEVHHRVKNNLQVISGILSLQNSIVTDEKAKQILAEGQDRIQAIALLHKTMYQNDNFNHVNLQTFINELITYIKQANKSLQKNITVIQDIENITFSIDTAIPLSLIINEIITNCYKHAFTNTTEGQISIAIKTIKPCNYLLSIKDNGRGLPKDFNPKNNSESIGFDLIYGLSEQLDGMVTINSGDETEILIAFTEIK
jgi:two-component sensor histidine kinase